MTTNRPANVASESSLVGPQRDERIDSCRSSCRHQACDRSQVGDTPYRNHTEKPDSGDRECSDGKADHRHTVSTASEQPRLCQVRLQPYYPAQREHSRSTPSPLELEGADSSETLIASCPRLRGVAPRAVRPFGTTSTHRASEPPIGARRAGSICGGVRRRRVFASLRFRRLRTTVGPAMTAGCWRGVDAALRISATPVAISDS